MRSFISSPLAGKPEPPQLSRPNPDLIPFPLAASTASVGKVLGRPAPSLGQDDGWVTSWGSCVQSSLVGVCLKGLDPPDVSDLVLLVMAGC